MFSCLVFHNCDHIIYLYAIMLSKYIYLIKNENKLVLGKIIQYRQSLTVRVPKSDLNLRFFFF